MHTHTHREGRGEEGVGGLHLHVLILKPLILPYASPITITYVGLLYIYESKSLWKCIVLIP